MEPDDNEVMGSKCTALILVHSRCGFAAFPSTTFKTVPDPRSGHGYGNFDRFQWRKLDPSQCTRRQPVACTGLLLAARPASCAWVKKRSLCVRTCRLDPPSWLRNSCLTLVVGHYLSNTLRIDLVRFVPFACSLRLFLATVTLGDPSNLAQL